MASVIFIMRKRWKCELGLSTIKVANYTLSVSGQKPSALAHSYTTKFLSEVPFRILALDIYGNGGNDEERPKL
jgi:hypothetical protein